jgi:hypothetical protein
MRREEQRTRRRAMRIQLTWRRRAAHHLNRVVRLRVRWLRTIPTWRPTDPAAAIMTVFGPVAGPGAVRVARCESNLDTQAQNGQYLGLFQEGSYARARYGYGPTAWQQAASAHRYWTDAGWAPWTCRFAA